ncbi:hypothetical protein CG08_0481 [Riemerella anatipestifer]|nr:hypothetical protein G148_1186 [Riemerella anatipestifer RA-CH-2]AKP68862.1 hypothetical protein CG08_0481 [Riemerella anatipestifer]AKP70725.1 hypothetical protein CG09_0465 [Riemerella anatipestifer]
MKKLFMMEFYIHNLCQNYTQIRKNKVFNSQKISKFAS